MILKNDDEKEIPSLECSKEEENKYSKKRKIIQIIIVIIFIICLIIGSIYFTPIVKALSNVDTREIYIEKLRSYGMFGSVILALLFAVQVIFAVIPSEPFEIIAGIMYGPWGGFFIAQIGLSIGSIIVYYLVRLFGKGFVKSLINIDSKKLDFLHDKTRSEVIIASILLIPGLPKDFLAFVVPFTKVSLTKFLIISFIARIPSIIMSTYLGDSFMTGNYTLTIILIGISIFIGGAGIIFNKKISNVLNKEKK